MKHCPSSSSSFPTRGTRSHDMATPYTNEYAHNKVYLNTICSIGAPTKQYVFSGEAEDSINDFLRHYRLHHEMVTPEEKRLTHMMAAQHLTGAAAISYDKQKYIMCRE